VCECVSVRVCLFVHILTGTVAEVGVFCVFVQCWDCKQMCLIICSYISVSNMQPKLGLGVIHNWEIYTGQNHIHKQTAL